MKRLLIVYLVFFACLANAQRIDKQQVFIATSEEEVYKLYNQMLDTARLSNYFLSPNPMVARFGFGFFDEMKSNDTIMKFVQDCKWNRYIPGSGYNDEYICERSYWLYLSNSMPIDFYERFLKHLKQLDKIENYYIKSNIYTPLRPIMDIIIKQYESGKLNVQDSIKARQLIEETLLSIINNEHDCSIVLMKQYDKYITDKIRQALIDIIENPFYPTEYLDFYMSKQDTLCVDTIGIPDYIKAKGRRGHFTDEEWDYIDRLERFFNYERIGRERYNGLSAGQAYLQEKREGFREKGYLPINYIEKYAYQKNDTLLIKYLKEFRKKYGEDYNKQQNPYFHLKYF